MATSRVPPALEAITAPVTAWSDASLGEGERQSRSRLTRRMLLLAAARRFDRVGYHAATLRDIVHDAEVTKGALYFHFSSKQDMTEALAAEVAVSWDRLVEEIATRDLDPLWCLLVETDTYVARWSHDPLVRGSSRALAEAEDLIDARRTWMNEWSAATGAHVRRAGEAGLLKPEVDAERLGRLVQALSAGHHALTESCPGSPDFWSRMCDGWRGLLPVVADDDWLAGWQASAWESRPVPDPAAYERARRP